MCTGSAALPKWSALALTIGKQVPSLYANSYRNPHQIQTSRVLVVGSGVQICQDLAQFSKFDEIILSVSHNRRFPWTVLGVAIHKIVKYLGLFDFASDARLARWILQTNKSRGDPATPPSPKVLTRQYGVRCVQKIQDFEAGNLVTKDGQRVSTRDLTIIWCTGFKPDYALLPVAVRDVMAGTPGWPTASYGKVPGFSGLHFLGQRFQSKLSSHILYGIGRDAGKIAHRIKLEMQ